MAKTKTIEAEITTANGTVISLKGNKGDVSEVIALFVTGGTASPSARDERQPFKPTPNLEGLAEVDEEGNLHIIASDLKADSQKDAAKRLIYLTLHARKELLNERKSDRSAVKEVLNNYNLYDSNTRTFLANDKGLIRGPGKVIGLSGPAIKLAGQYVREVMDDSISGKWNPVSTGRKKAKKKKKKRGKKINK